MIDAETLKVLAEIVGELENDPETDLKIAVNKALIRCLNKLE